MTKIIFLLAQSETMAPGDAVFVDENGKLKRAVVPFCGNYFRLPPGTTFMDGSACWDVVYGMPAGEYGVEHDRKTETDSVEYP